ncbi:hypothetical protein AAFF_G00402720 [Aldrovandia affinis]|uniref:Gastrin/cholecystokinin peptide hormone domain-containing protein n=1 Tax=Aldrovandia affinis TaxID=143900 RepID=A0AAD7T7D0_9TELE|nr:hypothetical protein AAFF_G00402720 [Aldrovandia affinis]
MNAICAQGFDHQDLSSQGQPDTALRSFPSTVHLAHSSPALLSVEVKVQAAVMNSGICVCVLLAALSTSCLGRPSSNTQDEGGAVPPQVDTDLSEHVRQSRSTPLSGQQIPLSKADEDVDPRASLNELLAKLISRKGNIRRNSTMNSRASGLSANHRMKDRDYLGWMDFGRRSAEEYEYAS